MANNEKTVENLKYLEDEIDLQAVGRFFKRNKRLLACFAGLGFLLGSVNGLSKPRIYQGQFQFIYSDNMNSSTMKPVTSLFVSSLLPSKTKTLKTEVIILSSPYLLNSIFEFVKNEKSKTNKNYSDIRFDEWANTDANVWDKWKIDPNSADSPLMRSAGSSCKQDQLDKSWPTPTSMRGVDAETEPVISNLYRHDDEASNASDSFWEEL